MKTIFDQLAKAILTAALRDVAQLESNREIRGHVLEADLWVEPDENRDSVLSALGMLGRMVALGPCLIEPFSGVPKEHELRSCILKQYSLAHAQRRDAKTKRTPASPFPRLWVIAAGSPDAATEAMELRSMQDWSSMSLEGAVLCGRPFDRFYLVVVRKLPRTPETVFLRLLSRGTTFREAIYDLAQVPESTPELAVVAERIMHVLVVFGKELPQDDLEENDMEALRDIEAAYSDWERRVKAEAKRETLVRICNHFQIKLTEDRMAQIANCSTQQLDDLLVEISATREWPDKNIE